MPIWIEPIGRDVANDRPCHGLDARSGQSVETDGLPSSGLERQLSERSTGCQLHGQPDIACGGVAGQRVGHPCRQLAADDLADEAVTVDGFIMGSDDRSVAHHDEAIGNRLQFGEAMADVDHPDPPGTERPDHGEQPVHLPGVERGRRLVEEEKVRFSPDRSGDLDDLPVADRQLGHLGIEPDRVIDHADRGGRGAHQPATVHEPTKSAPWHPEPASGSLQPSVVGT